MAFHSHMTEGVMFYPTSHSPLIGVSTYPYWALTALERVRCLKFLTSFSLIKAVGLRYLDMMAGVKMM